MKTHIVMYFTHDGAHQQWKIVEEDHDKAMQQAYKRFNPDWKNESEPNNKDLLEDFYRNAEVIAIIDAPMNSVELTYNSLVYVMPPIDPESV